MPAIKKKWIKASQDGTDVPEDDNDDMPGDEDRELADAGDDREPSRKPSPKKRPAQSSPQSGLLKGLDGEVLLEKRKRFVPASELKLSEWLDNNLEKRTEETLHLPHLYNYYTELCQSDGSDILDIPEFNRMVKEKFGKSFGLQETSVYKSLIKERKLNQKKKVGGGIKLKEIVHEAINHFGNPWNGVRFFNLKTYIGTKYPALQIDLRPKLLKRALEMGLQYGQIDLVKGIGMAGFYKLPGGEPPPPKVKPKSKKEESGEKQEGAEEKGTEGEEGAEKVEGSAENGEKKEPEEEKKKRKQKKKTEKVSLSKLHHSNPTKIEDTFPLAITYQSAPKAVSVIRIRRYIQEKYGEVLPDNRWRKVIESGAEKDYWEYVSGSGIAGKLHLLMDDFNPGSDQVEDMICAAIIACHEPKAASANQIKKYVSQYHPEFKVDERPDKFKKALIRAVSKNMIVQLSGLGASGSFQLSSAFVPSPSVLAGEDASSDEEVDSEGEAPVYVPRGTKSRGMPKLKTMEVVKSPPPKSRKKKGQKKSEVTESRKRGKKPKYADSSEEEEESEDEAPRRKNKKKADKKKAAKGKSSSRKRARSSSPSDVEAGFDDEPEYTPRKSKSRGGSSQKTVKPAKQLEKKAAKVSKKKKAKIVESVKTSMMTSEGKRVSMLEIKPTKSEKEGGKKSKSKSKSHSKSPEKKSKGKSPSKKQRVADSDDADEESEAELEYTPRKSKSRGGGGDESGKKEKSSKSRK